MSIEKYFIFIVITTTFLLSPGPSVLLSITNGVQYGVENAAIGVLGNVVAFQILVALSAVGLGALLTASTTFFMAMKMLGALYMIYLGVKIWFSPILIIPVMAAVNTHILKKINIFKHAFITTCSNPKALVYVSALLPQFIEKQQAFVPQVLIFGVTSAVIQFIIFMSYAVIGHKSKSWLESRNKLKLFNRVSGLTFVGFGVALGLSNYKL
ncbi:MAG: LysE family translocator [Exilibacterium sp.]